MAMKNAINLVEYYYDAPTVVTETQVVTEKTTHVVRFDGEELVIETTDVGEVTNFPRTVELYTANGGFYEQRVERTEKIEKNSKVTKMWSDATDKFREEMRTDLAERFEDVEERGGMLIYEHWADIKTPVSLGKREHERRKALLARFLKQNGVTVRTQNCSTTYPNDVCERVDDAAADLTAEEIRETIPAEAV